LEYYEGILFLTTNRLTSFDLAFKSRIHLALRYSALTQERRKELWKIFIQRTSKDGQQLLEDSVLNDLSKVDLNGRQIKNAIRTANTLAKSTKQALNKDHIELVLETIREFEEDFHDSTEDSAMTQTLSRRTTGLDEGSGTKG
jgi:predicted ATP-dependent protease